MVSRSIHGPERSSTRSETTAAKRMTKRSRATTHASTSGGASPSGATLPATGSSHKRHKEFVATKRHKRNKEYFSSEVLEFPYGDSPPALIRARSLNLSYVPFAPFCGYKLFRGYLLKTNVESCGPRGDSLWRTTVNTLPSPESESLSVEVVVI